MRITGGTFGGRRIGTVKGSFRPTQDKVRAALFSIIAHRVAGSRFLDLYAGSGIVGLEALSRGAGSVCWVESDDRTMSLLKQNVEHVLGKAEFAEASRITRFWRGDAERFLEKGLETQQFDLIFADPPYDKSGVERWVSRILGALGRGNVLAPGGLFVMEQSSADKWSGDDLWVLVDDRVYGETRLMFFVRR